MMEAKLVHLDERLQRIEKIIDRLQLSIIQKVGEYMINVSDLKKELIETQKSFKTVAYHPQKTPSHQEPVHHHPHQHSQHASPHLEHHHKHHTPPSLPSLHKKTKHKP